MAMSLLSMMEAKLPPGFRFHPRDEELITDYLVKKITGDSSSGGNYFPLMEVVDLNKVEPWELPGTACVGGKEWYFYSLRDRKYATGQRTNRATISGYWKATGKDRHVSDGRRGGELVGMRKTLVFYQGRAPKGKKTEWVMHEFRMEGRSQHHHIPNQNPTSASSSSSSSSNSNPFKEDWVLCRVFYKGRGLSPKSTTSNGSNMSSYGDTISSSSSFPPLMDTYINFEQPHLLTQNNNNGYNNDQWKNDQVPCFSNLQFHHQLPPPPLLPPPLIETKNMYSSSSSSAAQLGTCHMPDMTSLLHPLVNFPSEKKAVKAILHHLSSEVDWRSAASLAESSEIFKAETDEHDSLWNSF